MILPHKVRVLLASAMSSLVMIWQVYTPSSPGSTLAIIRSGPSNVYLRKYGEYGDLSLLCVALPHLMTLLIFVTTAAYFLFMQRGQYR